MFAWLLTLLHFDEVTARGHLDDGATRLALLARFVDELASGLVLTLLPTLRAAARVSVTQVGVALQAMDLLSGVVDPLAGATVDLWRRRPLLVAGAVGWVGALLILAGLPGLAGLVAGFALIGAASGMLCHTADVVLIEGHPCNVDRVSTVSTIVDTTGALLAPLAVTVTFALGGPWRPLLTVTALVALLYAVALARVAWPVPASVAGASVAALARSIVTRALRVLTTRQSRLWLGVLVLEGLLDVVGGFQALWLADVAGFSQSLVGVHVVVELLGGLAGLVLLDRLLRRFDGVAVLRWSLLALLLLYPAWLFAGGVAWRLGLVALREVAAAPVWPIARGRALDSAPGSGGTVSALRSVTSLVPVTLAFGWAADRTGFTPTMLVVAVGAIAAMLGLVSRGASR